MPKITFTISKDGQVTADAEGFKGKACLKETDKILSGLGTIEDQKLKDDYYAKEGVEINVGR